MLCGSRNAILRGVYAFAKRLDDAGASRLLWRRLFAPKTLDERRGKIDDFAGAKKKKFQKYPIFLVNFRFFSKIGNLPKIRKIFFVFFFL